MNKDLISTDKKKESIDTFNTTREKIISSDRRFSEKNDHLLFENIDLYDISKKIQTPFYLYSELEIIRNITEIKEAFKNYPNTKIFYASKACSLIKILEIVKDNEIFAESNSIYEIMKCIKSGFKGSEIIFNGVLKKKSDLEYAIKNNIYSINVDSFYELDLIEEITNELQIEANISIRIEPNVSSPTHPDCVTAYHAKAGIDLKDAELMCKKIINMPYVNLKGLHIHIGDQIPIIDPFSKAVKVIIDEAKRLENSLNIKFKSINLGGGIPVPYKYGQGNPLKDYLYTSLNSSDFANIIIDEVLKWRDDIEICIEPGRKIVSSAAVLLTTIYSEKIKTNYDDKFNILDIVNWKFIDAGYSILSDSLHFNWFFYLFNTKNIKDDYTLLTKIAGPLCDGGDYFHQGVYEEFFLLPKNTSLGDTLAFIDTGAYSIESQTIYNNRPRSAVALITKEGNIELIRREDTFDDIISYDIY